MFSSFPGCAPLGPAGSGPRGRALIAAWLLVLAACVPRSREPDADRDSAKPAAARSAPQLRAARLDSIAPPQHPAKSSAPLIKSQFVDRFERPSLGPDWLATGPGWRIDAGRLCVQNARNHPLWLRRRLPTNAVIEFSATSHSPSGDIKAEFWGDGRSHASSASYSDASSYLAIFGGWSNRYHVLTRLDEHAPGRKQIQLAPQSADPLHRPVTMNQTYRFRVERRDGRAVRWSVDGRELLSLVDDRPLRGPGHDHFGFNDWQARVCFDELSIRPL